MNSGQVLPIFIPLLTAHFVADFLIQTDDSIQKKNKFWNLIKHGLIVGLISYIFLGILIAWEIILGIVITHILLDAWKIKTTKGTRLSRFAGDQLGHILVIFLISAAAGGYKYLDYSDIWTNLFGPIYLKLLALIAGGIICIYAISFLIELVLESLGLKKKEDQGGGIKDGGRIIGYLERSLIFLFILVDYPAGIGFLIAAKSVFRFGELTSPDKRIQAEYIIIGTLLSVLFGTVAAYLTAQILLLITP